MNWHEMTCGERDELMRQYLSEGQQSFTSGGNISECPYREDKQEAIWWRRGFGNAMLGACLDRQC